MPESTAIPPQEPPRIVNRPKRPEIRRLQTLESAANAGGEVFAVGDKITVKAPWNEMATAEIVSLYQDRDGKAWAEYTPIDSRADWPWEGGCTHAIRLVRATDQ